MQIRTKLTLQYLLLGELIMLAASITIYFSSVNFRRNDFLDLLKTRSVIIAKQVLDSYEFNPGPVLQARADYNARLQDEKFLILNYQNDTLFKSDRNLSISGLNTIIESVKSGREVFVRKGDYDVLGTMHTNGIYQFVLIGAAIDRDGILHLKLLKMILLIVSLISLVSFYFAGWFFSGRALRPISDMVKKVDEISITSLHLRVPEGNGTDEIGRLAKTFNKMLERLESSFETQKNFIANASHELRTPLTSINGQIEVITMNDRSPDEYKSALVSVLEDIKLLIDLANRLILIARTSSEGPSSFSKRIRIDEILYQAREDLARFKSEFHIRIEMDDSLTESEQMLVTGDEYLLKVAMSNLIENACKYSADKSVEITWGYADHCINVIFADKGIGIPREDIPKIFEPFYRGKNVTSIPGSGVGLSLVNQIIKNHNGTITVISEVGSGTKIILSIPSASQV